MVYLTTSLTPVNTAGRLHSLLSMNGGRIKGLHMHFENMAGIIFYRKSFLIEQHCFMVLNLMYIHSLEMINSAGGALLVISAVMALLNLVNMFIQRQMGRSPKLLFSHEGASLDTIRIGLGETIAFGKKTT